MGLTAEGIGGIEDRCKKLINPLFTNGTCQVAIFNRSRELGAPESAGHLLHLLGDAFQLLLLRVDRWLKVSKLGRPR